MDNDRPTDELLRRMLAAVLRTLGDEETAAQLIESARAEAEAEVKELLKAAMKATLLQRAVSRLESDVGPAEAAIATPTPAPAEPPDEEPRLEAQAVGCYVYGITRAGLEPPPDVPGIEPESPVRFIREGALQTLTSDIRVDHYEPAALGERAQDLAWIEGKVRAHDAVLKELLACGAVVPCRFGTVLRDEQAVRAVLSRHADSLLATLEALDGKKEWGVKVLAGRDLRPAAAAEDSPSGRAYFLQKKRNEQARSDAARAAREAADACHDELSGVAAAATKLPTSERGAAGSRRARGEAEMVSNGAYLVADADAERFHALVAALAERYAPLGLALEVTGPWPPYNFVSLDLSIDPPPVRERPEAAA